MKWTNTGIAQKKFMVKKKETIHLAVDNNQELIRIDKFFGKQWLN